MDHPFRGLLSPVTLAGNWLGLRARILYDCKSGWFLDVVFHAPAGLFIKIDV